MEFPQQIEIELVEQEVKILKEGIHINGKELSIKEVLAIGAVLTVASSNNHELAGRMNSLTYEAADKINEQERKFKEEEDES